MLFRKTKVEDIENVMVVINQAQKYMATLNIDQWQNGYPSKETINADIDLRQAYVLENDGEIIGTVAISFQREKDYEEVKGIGWKNPEEKYIAIHRIAVKDKCRGLGVSAKFVEEAQKICRENEIKSLRVDTHQGNLTMQNFLKKQGFYFCGEIHIDCVGDTLRYIYEKEIL